MRHKRIESRRAIGEPGGIEAEESEHHAVELFQSLSRKLNLRNAHLHSDNGNPMKGATMLMTLYALGVIPSFSRPRVHDDNPYSEALFKTLKYTVGYPRHFSGLDHARDWMASFVDWYNTEHLHSALGFVTPQQRYEGSAEAIFEVRNQKIREAYRRHPERWSRKPRTWAAPAVVYLNPSEATRQATQESVA